MPWRARAHVPSAYTVNRVGITLLILAEAVAQPQSFTSKEIEVPGNLPQLPWQERWEQADEPRTSPSLCVLPDFQLVQHCLSEQGKLPDKSLSHTKGRKGSSVQPNSTQDSTGRACRACISHARSLRDSPTSFTAAPRASTTTVQSSTGQGMDEVNMSSVDSAAA